MPQQRSIIFWNVERLFETSDSVVRTAINAPDTFTEKQINQKIKTIAAVLSDISKKAGPPLLVGMVEVQTPQLAAKIASAVQGVSLEQIDAHALDKFGESLDAINITLLYDKSVFGKVEKIQSHIIDRTFETRDILEVKFAQNKDRAPLSVFVSHWPSRLSAEGAGKRIAAAYYLRSLVSDVVRFPMKKLWDASKNAIKMPNNEDLIQKASDAAILMGDFNDEPFDESIEILRTTADVEAVANDLKIQGNNNKERFRSYVSSVPYLVNPFWHFLGSDIGTYYRSPRWRLYDQIMFTHGLLTPEIKTPSYIPGEAHIYNEKKITLPDGVEISLTNNSGKPVSFDPASGNGCSDHFCIYIKVQW